MSVRFRGIADLLYRSQAFGDSIPQQDPLTVCGWLYVYADINNAGPLFARYANATGTERSGAYVDATGDAVLIEPTASTGTWTASQALTLGRWQFWAYRRHGSTHELFFDAGTVKTGTGAPAADTSAAFVFGCTTTEYVAGQFARWRIWESALTDAEILAEKHSATAVRPGAWADYPMKNGAWATDTSGNHHTLRTSGALTNGTSEPLAIVSHPSNTGVVVGATATFTVVAIGVGVTYQWQDDRSGAFSGVSDGSGGATTSYTTGLVSEAFDGRQYRVIATDASGRTTSAVARLGVVRAPTHLWGTAISSGIDVWPHTPAIPGSIFNLVLTASLAAVARRIALANVTPSSTAAATRGLGVNRSVARALSAAAVRLARCARRANTRAKRVRAQRKRSRV